MYIKQIKLTNFRNYDEEKITLKNGVNLVYGMNAQGKTNIIESIFVSSFGKSFRAKKEKEMIKENKEDAIIEVEYEKKDRQGKIKIILGEKKEVYVNQIKIKKLSELLGKINIVNFCPDDINILKTGPQARRRFLNMMISQLKPNYVHCINMYLKNLEQRNKYLKQIKIENKNPQMLDIWDENIAEYSQKVYKYREEYIEKIKKIINDKHSKITDGKENVEIVFLSDCKEKEKYLEELKKDRESDIKKGYTTKGIHRDDFEVYINGKKVNIYGSQGQNRTIVLSLKMCELEIIKEETNELPILLLDDFMSELDKKRIKSFFDNIEKNQVIVTCTERIESNFECEYFEVIEGKVIKR